VLFLTDRVDEWMLNFMHDFDGKPLQSVAKGAFDLGTLQDEEEKKKAEEAAKAAGPLVERLKEQLKERVRDVRVSARLVDSPACIVVEEGDASSHLARLMQQAGQGVPETLPILEINPQHPLVSRLDGHTQFDDLAHLILDHAVLAEGGQLKHPAEHVQRITRVLTA